MAASTTPAEIPSSSRIANQAAVATHAGLSVDDDRGEDVELPGPQQAAASVNQAALTPAAAAPPVTLPQLASKAGPPTAAAASVNPPTAAAATVPSARSAALAPARTSQPDAPSQSPSTAEIVTNLLQTSPTSTADNQTLILPQTPTNPAITAGATASTRPTQTIEPLPSPAIQVAQAIVEPVKVILSSPAQAGPTTPYVTTIQITPVELGRVEVRIERTNDGSAKIQLVAERPETLSRLVHDQSQLQQALDHVGIKPDSRTIEFSLAPTATDGGTASSSFFSNDASGGDASGNGFQRQNNAYYNQNSNESDDNQLSSPTQSRTVRTGIDITA